MLLQKQGEAKIAKQINLLELYRKFPFSLCFFLIGNVFALWISKVIFPAVLCQKFYEISSGKPIYSPFHCYCTVVCIIIY